VRLISIAEHYWYEIDGPAALAGVNLMRLPFRRFLLAVLSWARPYKEDEIKTFDEWLYSPLAPLDPDRVSEDVIEDEMAAFRAFSKQAGGLG
jgi:hypothetical protein